jgi:hypothetical protein
MATVVIMLLILFVLGGTGVLALHVLGLAPPWMAQTRHALGEAAYRARGVIAEFGDWLRLGR